MSKTYKTDPSWVKIHNAKVNQEVMEHHDHADGECRFDSLDPRRPFWWQQGRGAHSCGYDVRYYEYHGGFYSRGPWGKFYRRRHEGRTRTQWRKAKHDLLKLDGQALEDYDVISYQHRHSALWDLL